MKILRIQFKNLNSLPSGDIDLEHGRLAHAGIFAITGPTGAGKSTILDAITLALYGRAARYDTAANPEDMMSRHAAACQAEVLFEVRGQRYRAEWHLRRARGKADGKVQPATRRLYHTSGPSEGNSEDGSDEPLTQNSRETDRLIEEIIGLNYDRFLRSVLLAQGQFARFLKATENERAELLESLTATTIYSELSSLAYREASDRESALQQRRAALGNIAPLDEETKATKREAIDSHAAELLKLQAQQTEAAQQLHRGQQRLDVLGEKSALETLKTTLALQRENAAPALQKLAIHRQAEPFSSVLQTFDTLTERLGVAQKELDETHSQTRNAERDLIAALSAGRRLHSEALSGSLKHQRELQEQRETLQQRLAKGGEWLAAHKHHAALEEALPGLIETLAQLTVQRRGQQAAIKTQGDLEKEQKTSSEALATKLSAHLKAQKELQTSQFQSTERRNALNNLLQGQTLAALTNSTERFDAKLHSMSELRVAIQKRDAAAIESTRLIDRETKLVDEIEQAKIQKAATEVEAKTQAAILEKARQHLSLQERIAGLEEHRMLLVDGEACPLCGGADHPFAQHDKKSASKEIEEAQRHIEVARGANETAAKEAELATHDLARTTEELRSLQQRRGELRRAQMDDHEHYEKLARHLRVFTSEQLIEAVAATTKARMQNSERIANIQQAEKNLATQELTQAQLTGEEARLAEGITAAKTADALLLKRHGEATDFLHALASELEATSEALTQALAPYSLPLPAAGEEPATRQALETLHRQYQNGVRIEVDLKTKLQQCEHSMESATVHHKGLEREGEAFVPYTPTHSSPTSEVNTATEANFLHTWGVTGQPLDEAKRHIAALRAHSITLQATLAERLKRVQETAQTQQCQENELAQLLADTPFPNIASLRAARLAPAALQEVEAQQKRLASDAERLAAQEAQVEAQLAKLHDAPAGDAFAALQQSIEPLKARIVEEADQRSRLQKELEDDDALRARLSSETEALEREQARLATWLQLRQLIGSADGKKFSRYAQGLSLELLVRHANGHLGRLNDRYTLRRSGEGDLVLEIVDRHQADAVRPMQSLSGGESFLVSLALALGLSDLAGRNVRIDSLFIDEGFGSLDADTLDTAVSALDTLRLNEKTVGIISHVELLKERIPVQIHVVKKAGGLSAIEMP